MLEARDQQILRLEKMLDLAEKSNTRQHARHRKSESSNEEAATLRATLDLCKAQLAEKQRAIDSMAASGAGKTPLPKPPTSRTPAVAKSPAPGRDDPFAPTSLELQHREKDRTPAPLDISYARTPVPASSNTPAHVGKPTPGASRTSPHPRHTPAPDGDHRSRMEPSIAREALAVEDALRRAEQEMQWHEEARQARIKEEEERLAAIRDQERHRQARILEEEENAQRRREEEERAQRRKEEEERAQRRREEEERANARLRELEEETQSREQQAEVERETRQREEESRREQELASRAAIEKAKEERRKKDALLAKVLHTSLLYLFCCCCNHL